MWYTSGVIIDSSLKSGLRAHSLLYEYGVVRCDVGYTYQVRRVR